MRQDAACFIKVKGLKENIGHVKYYKKLRKYVSFTYFPYRVPYAHRRTVREFQAEITKKSGLPGRYYIDMSSGLCGYYELSDTALSGIEHCVKRTFRTVVSDTLNHRD